MSELIDIAQSAVKLARELGATDAECTISQSEEFSTSVRMREIETIKDAYKLIFMSGALMPEVKAKLADMAETSPHCRQMLSFIEASQRALLR